jgi:hypothetical protein
LRRWACLWVVQLPLWGIWIVADREEGSKLFLGCYLSSLWIAVGAVEVTMERNASIFF